MPSIIPNNSTMNDSVSDEMPGSQPKWLNVLQYTMFTAIFVISVIGNTLVCLVIARTPRMRTTRNFLLVNLAVADLTVALLCIPFEVALKITYPRWPLGSAMCKILWPTMTSVTTCSSATLVAISYDRYRAVVHPWKPRFTLLQTVMIISFTWSVSFVLVIPYLLVLSINNNYCEEVWPSNVTRRVYTLGLFIIQFIVPLVIIAFAYTKVVLKLRDQAARFSGKAGVQESMASPRPGPSSSFLTAECSDINSISGSPLPDKKFSTGLSQIQLPLSPRSPKRGSSKAIQRLERNTKLVKMLLTVVLLYAICMLPNQVVWLWYEFGSGQRSQYIKALLTLGSSMVYLNSSVNPILYAGMNEEFRRGFLGLLRCHCRRPTK